MSLLLLFSKKVPNFWTLMYNIFTRSVNWDGSTHHLHILKNFQPFLSVEWKIIWFKTTLGPINFCYIFQNVFLCVPQSHEMKRNEQDCSWFLTPISENMVKDGEESPSICSNSFLKYSKAIGGDAHGGDLRDWTEETRRALADNSVAGVSPSRRERKEGMTNGVILAHLWRQYYDVNFMPHQLSQCGSEGGILWVSVSVSARLQNIWE